VWLLFRDNTCLQFGMIDQFSMYKKSLLSAARFFLQVLAIFVKLVQSRASLEGKICSSEGSPSLISHETKAIRLRKLDIDLKEMFLHAKIFSTFHNTSIRKVMNFHPQLPQRAPTNQSNSTKDYWTK